MSPWLEIKRKNVIYARVSNTKQKNDLEKQIDILRGYVVSNGNIVDDVYSDIGSGMNENRTSLISLIKAVTSNQVDSVYISYKDRLSRFGYGYFETFFSQFGTKIVVVNSTAENDFQSEIMEEI
jgi:predicted site-specific integrase-resolvase